MLKNNLKTNKYYNMGPGLAQLVEHLTVEGSNSHKWLSNCRWFDSGSPELVHQ
jgi:hypothetical protein